MDSPQKPANLLSVRAHSFPWQRTFFLMSLGVSFTKMAELLSLALILPLSPCRSTKHGPRTAVRQTQGGLCMQHAP